MKCCVPQCKNRNDGPKLPGLTMHRFPRDPVLKESWLRGICREAWSPSKSSIVCSFHFKHSDFMAGVRGESRLRPKAVPSLNVDTEVAPTESAAATLAECGPTEVLLYEVVQVASLQDVTQEEECVEVFYVPAAPPTDSSTQSPEVSAQPTDSSTQSPEASGDLVLCISPSPSPSPEKNGESREASPGPSAHTEDSDAATPTSHGRSPEREETPEKAFLRSEVTRYSILYRGAKKKIKTLQQCRRRLTSRVAHLQDEVKELKARVLDAELKAS
ncbi:uncharacterized protein LOC144168944 [Haemaphysalis longicornis]